MEDYFIQNFQNAIKKDINKWQKNQQFFNKLFEGYEYQIQIQTLINQRNREKVKLLKEELKSNLRQNIKQMVQEKLESKQLLTKNNSNHNFRSKKCISVKSESKVKFKTEYTEENTMPTSKNTILLGQRELSSKRKITKYEEQIQSERRKQQQLPHGIQRTKRIKTQMSLPLLRKQKLQTQSSLQLDFNYMKPIHKIKKTHKTQSILPQIIKIFTSYYTQIHQKSLQLDWFQKVVFNKRNYQKILSHLNKQLKQHENSQNKRYSQSNNKVKDLIAKNFFRLKTESCVMKNNSNLKDKLKDRYKDKDKSMLQIVQKSTKSQKVIN